MHLPPFAGSRVGPRVVKRNRVESQQEIYIDPAAARRDYVRKLEAHVAAARNACDKLGITYHRFTSDRPLELALFDFLRSRMQRGAKAKRTGGKLTRPAAAA